MSLLLPNWLCFQQVWTNSGVSPKMGLSSERASDCGIGTEGFLGVASSIGAAPKDLVRRSEVRDLAESARHQAPLPFGKCAQVGSGCLQHRRQQLPSRSGGSL